MTKEEYLKELNKAFGDFKFYEESHSYTYKGKPISIGATGLIGQYENEFDSETIAQKVASKENRPVEEILAEWKYKADFACEKGTNGHNFVQSLWDGETYQPLPFDGSDVFKMANNSIYEQATNFYEDYKDKLELIYNEYVIGAYEFDLASAIDALFINKLTGGLVLVDYKTNSYMSGYNKTAYKKAMKVPLSHLNDDAYHHYQIQLSMYKYIVEKYTDLKIEEMFIVYMSENIDNYEIIEISYLEKEVEEILEWRKWE